MTISIYLALIARLTAGAIAIQSPATPLDSPRATNYAEAAAYFGLRAGVDPFELLAVARNESDFVEDMRGPDGKDCGLTQTRTTITRYTCRQLRHSYRLAFQEAARELSEYARACQGHGDFDRCRLNHYNSGARYARRGVHGAYWLRVTCFAEAARAGAPVGSTCRRAAGRRDVRRIVQRALRQSAPAAMAAVVRPSS